MAAEISKEAPNSVLHLNNGDHVTGSIVSQETKDSLGWKSPSFAIPFQFPLGRLASIHFPTPAKLPEPQGEYSFELITGDLLFGSLVSIEGKTAVLAVTDIGRLTVDLANLARIVRRGAGNDVLFIGPGGLTGWQTPSPEGAWREDAGQLVSDKPGAILRRDFAIPDRARIEFELSWKNLPDFELAVAVDDNPKTVARAFRFDVWDNELVIQRETERDADVERVQELTGKSGRIHVQAFLDQTKGRILVCLPNGEQLKELTVVPTKPQIFGGLQLTNRRGDVRLERLQIGRWNDQMPHKVEVDKSRIYSVDGAVTYGELKSFDAEKKEFLVIDEAKSQTFAEANIQDIFLAHATEVKSRALRADYLTGMRISGDLDHVEAGTIWLKAPGIEQPIAIQLTSLQAIVALEPKSDPPDLPQRKGRLEISGATLQGCLVDGEEGAASCLVWQPQQSSNSSALVHGIPAKIIYKEPPKPQPTPQPNAQMGVQLGAGNRVIRRNPPTRQPDPSSTVTTSSESILHLLTGDKFPCQEVAINERGVTFKSSEVKASFIPHELIHALELQPNQSPVQIENKKKDRLLTLPRMQRDNPPTHLIRSVDGDYLRGRLDSMDDTQVQIELRLEGKIVRRDRVARVIWLHPEESSGSDVKPSEPAKAVNPNLVQALHGSMTNAGTKLPVEGKRVTFVPERLSGSVLSGQSQLIGECTIDLTQVDQLLVGDAIAQASVDLPFGSWKLKPATDPVGSKESPDGNEGGGEGLESALVGKPAPDISLKALDGSSFTLASHRDKVVILDFWASWCGPCLQAMPQIDRVAEEFAGQGVVLFAINLQETPDKVKAALERLKLSPTVLLDTNGRIAEKYGATAIPQTVIINRDGKVARLFVGGGARFEDQLRTALKSVLSGEPEKEPAKTE